MEYNKNRFQKTDDKKVLHKVRKQWVVLSMSLLAALGGGAAVANHVSAHADTTNNNHVSAQNTLKERLNQSLVNENKNANQQKLVTNQNRQNSNQQTTPKVSSNEIANQASALHNRILQNADLNGTQNVSHASVLKEQVNVPKMGNLKGSTKYYDPNQLTNSDQASLIGSGSTVPSGYALDSLSVGTNINNPGSDLNVSKIQSGNEEFSNIPYSMNYQTAGGSAESAYNYTSDKLSARTSDGVAPKSLASSVGASLSGSTLVNTLGIQAAPNANDYSVNTSDTATITPTGVQWTDGSGKVVSDPTFTAKANKSGAPITVNLIDQSGNKVASDQITSSNDVGNTIDVASAVNKDGKIATNYSLSAGQYNDYAFSDNSQTVTLRLNGKADTAASANIGLYYKNHNGSTVSSVNSAYNLASLVASGEATINNDVDHAGSTVDYGDTVTINPNANSFQSSGYTGSNNSAVQLYVSGNGSLYDVANNSIANSADTSTHNFNYVENANTATPSEMNSAQTKVTYINQEGSTVTSSANTNFSVSDYGKTVDLASSKGGIAPPSGYDLNYSLDDNDATKYTPGKSSTNPRTLYVIGKKVTTNGNPSSQNHGLGSYTLPIKIYEEQSDGKMPSSAKGIFNPKIQGRVGSSMIITPSDFLDNGQLNNVDSNLNNSNYGLDHNDQEYRITFESGGQLGVTTVNPDTPNDTSNDGAVSNPTDTSNDSSKGIIFRYVSGAGSSKPASTKTIRVNYLYQDQNYVENGTPTQKWIQLPGTTVSDKNNNSSSSFNIGTYEQNPPKGYQFVKVLNVNPNGKTSDNDNQPSVNSDGTPVQNNVNARSDSTQPPTNFAHDAVVNLEVIPTAGDITVQYYNQNGVPLASNGTKASGSNQANDVIAGNSSSKNSVGAYSRYGQRLTIDGNNSLKDSQGQSFNLWNVPKGYHLVQNPAINNSSNNGYQFTRQPQTIKLTVVGDDINTNNPSNLINGIKIKKEDKNGVKNGSDSSDSHYVHGRIGNPTNLDPNDFAPAGYHATPSDHPFVVNFNSDGHVTHNGKTNFTPPQWNYVPVIPDHEQPFNIRINYVNDKTGKTVNNGGSLLNGYYGENFNNVTSYIQVPNGYRLDGNQVVNYTLGSGRAAKSGDVVTLKVAGNTINSSNNGNLPFDIYRVYRDFNGREHISDQRTTVSQLKNYNNIRNVPVGSSFTVNPSDYNPDPSNYTDDSIDAPASVQVIPNPNGSGVALSTNQVVFYYDHQRNQHTQAQPIVVHYMNKKTGKQVGTNDIINGNYGKSIHISDGVISGANKTGQPNSSDANRGVPYGYAADSSDNLGDVKFGSDIQNIYLNLTGNTVQDKVVVHQVYRNPDGTFNHESDKPVNLSGQVGDTFTISPYRQIDSGYHAANSDDDDTITLGANGHIFMNGSYIANNSNNNTYSIGYVYNKNYDQTGNTLDTITIHYVDGSSEVDREYDHGTTNKTFDITPYENDIPSGVSGKYYHYDAAETKSDSRNNVSVFKNNGNTVNGQPNNQDVYIHVDVNSSNNDTTGGPNSGNDSPNNQN